MTLPVAERRGWERGHFPKNTFPLVVKESKDYFEINLLGLQNN